MLRPASLLPRWPECFSLRSCALRSIRYPNSPAVRSISLSRLRPRRFIDTSATLSQRSEPLRVLRRGPGAGPGEGPGERLDLVRRGGPHHVDHFPQRLLRPHLGEVAGAEGDAHQGVPDALGSVQGVTLARSLPVELQLAEDLAGRLLGGNLGEVRRAEVDAAEDIPEDLGAAQRVLLAADAALAVPAAARLGGLYLVARRLVALLGGLDLVARRGRLSLVAPLGGGRGLLGPCALGVAGAVILLLRRRLLVPLLLALLWLARLWLALRLARLRLARLWLARRRRIRGLARPGRPGLLVIRVIGWLLVTHDVPSGAAPVTALSASMTRHHRGWCTTR